jgi:hypothetical protein
MENEPDGPPAPAWTINAMLKTKSFMLTDIDLATPATLIASAYGVAVVAKIADQCWYRRWEDSSSRRPMNLAEGNKLAKAILEARSQGDTGLNALAAALEGGETAGDCLRSTAPDACWEAIQRLIEAVREQQPGWKPAGEEYDWGDALEDAVIGVLEADDDSDPTDALGRHDRCELLFMIGKPENGWEDDAITSHGRWMEPSNTVVDLELQRGLAGLGWTIGEFRTTFGNIHPTSGRLGRPRVRPSKLVTATELDEMISNHPTSCFGFCLYAMVPVTDIVALDPTKPATFDRVAVATYDPMNGAFHEILLKGPVTTNPREGRFQIPGYWISPDDICGFNHGPFEGRITNHQAKQGGPASQAQTQAPAAPPI